MLEPGLLGQSTCSGKVRPRSFPSPLEGRAKLGGSAAMSLALNDVLFILLIVAMLGAPPTLIALLVWRRGSIRVDRLENDVDELREEISDLDRGLGAGSETRGR